MRTRDSNLDLLRAAAILMVVVYHVAQRWPVALPRLTAFTQYGEHGVDLFFVLSGWLIGGLLWREHEKFGNVQITRFICRRASRTVPPYLVALAIFYLGVFVTRRERLQAWELIERPLWPHLKRLLLMSPKKTLFCTRCKPKSRHRFATLVRVRSFEMS